METKQSKTFILLKNVDQSRNRVFNCHLSPNWPQMAIEKSVSSDFYLRSSIVKSTFDCHLSGVMLCTIFSYSDSSLQELVKRILPLCSNYSTVVRFIEGKDQHIRSGYQHMRFCF